MNEDEVVLENTPSPDNTAQPDSVTSVTDGPAKTDAPTDVVNVSVQQLEKVNAHLSNIQALSVVSMVGIGVVAGLVCGLIFAMFFKHI